MYDLTDEQCDKIKNSLPEKDGDSGRTAKDNRGFIRAVMWIANLVLHGGCYQRSLEIGQMYTKDS